MADSTSRARAAALVALLVALALGALLALAPGDGREDAAAGPSVAAAGSDRRPRPVVPDLAARPAVGEPGAAAAPDGDDVDRGAASDGDAAELASAGEGAEPSGPTGEDVLVLEGRVLGPGDQVVPGTVVVARRDTLELRDSAERLRLEVDREGRFQVRVAAGRWFVGAEAPGHVPRERVAAVVRPGRRARVELRLVRAVSALTGRVLGVGDRPLPGARVQAWNDGAVRREATSGADGAFALDGLPEGLYGVSARAPGHVSAFEADVAVTEAQGGEVTLRLAAGGRLEGRLTDPRGAPAAGANVFVYARGARVAATEADDEGRYDLDGLPAGRVELLLRSPDYGLSARVPVDVVAGGLVVRDAALADGLRITGRVVDAHGAPLAEVQLLAVELNGDVERRARSDAGGRYVVEHLYPGRYRLEATRRGMAAGLAEVDVTAGPATCDVTLTAGAVLAGVVLGPDGAPVAHATVHAVQVGVHRTAGTDDAGRFRFEGLTAGAYRVFLRCEGDRLVGRVEVELGSDTRLEDLRLLAHPPARVRGRVLDPAGRPLADLEVVLRGLDGPVWRDARTGQDGAYELGPLYEGGYELSLPEGALRLAARRLQVDRLELPPQHVTVSRGRDASCELRLRVPSG